MDHNNDKDNMDMHKVTPITERHCIGCYPDLLDEEINTVGERFSTSFYDFLQRQKEKAVKTTIKEEFPTLMENEAFFKKVVNRLDDNEIIKERRFVFLAINPMFKNRYR